MPPTFSRLVIRLGRRLRALTGGRALDLEHDEEVQLHLESEAEDLARRYGLSRDQARRRALIAFGGVTQVREAHRDARGVTLVDMLARDVHYSIRTLRRAKTFSISAILVLGLGVGTCTAVFSAVDAVLLARLPYPEPDRLVRIYLRDSPTVQIGLSTVDGDAIATQARTLSSVGIMARRNVAVAFGREPEQTQAGAVDAGIFTTLGVRPYHGRAILPSDNVVGAPPVAVVSNTLAAQAHGSSDRAVGRSITIDGIPHTIVGVLAPGIEDLAGFHADVWPALQQPPPTRRGPFNLVVVGRLAPSATLDGVSHELVTLTRRVYRQWVTSFQDSVAVYTPMLLRETLAGHSRQMLTLFASAVAFVLLIVIANVSNLTFVRAMQRQRELALRMTLGATRAQVARLLATESIVLALGGAITGLALAALILHAMRIGGPAMPRLQDAHIGLRAAAFAVVVAVAAGGVVGLLPPLLLLRTGVARPAGDATRSVSQSRSTVALRGGLVVGQFALALPLLAGAGLLLNSFLRLQQVWPGFDPAHVLTARVALPSARYPGDSAVRAFWTRAIAQIQDLPGVEAVGLGTATPPADQNVCCNNFELVDHPVAPGTAQPASPWITASADYFASLGLKRLDGRPFVSADTGGAPVVAVSQSWARHYFPEGGVIGRRLISGGCVTCPLTTIAAVVSDAKYMGLDANAEAVYSPVTEQWAAARSATLFIRTADNPTGITARVHATLRTLDPTLPLDDITPLTTRMGAALAPPRQLASLVGAFALAALLLAAIGVFGMLSYAVSTRRREIGVRMALGAGPRTVVSMVVRGGMTHAVGGALLGLVVTIFTVNRLTGTLYQVRPTDPPTLLGVAAVLLGVAFLASLLPALRASHIDPLESIRAD